MKIKILGSRGEIESSSPFHSKHSGILIDKKILFDLGEKNFLEQKPKFIFITHLHPDHAFFVTKKLTKLKIPIYAPEKHESNIKIIPKKVRANSFQIIPIPTIHSRRVKSRAYLIKKGKKKILYTGDMIWILKKYHSLFKNLDLVITEASFFKKGGLVRRDKKTNEIYGHTGVPDLVKLFSKFTRKIVLVHFGNWFYKNIKKSRKKINDLARQYDIKIIVGYDGLKIKI